MAAITDQEFNTIIETLSRDQQDTQRLIDILDKETHCLRKRTFDSLTVISHEKSQLIKTIETNNQSRQRLLQTITTELNPVEQLKQFIARCSTQQAQRVRKLNQNLEKNLSHCRNKNAVNGQVIAVSLKNNRELLNILTGKAQDDKLYDASGRVSSNAAVNNYKEV